MNTFHVGRQFAGRLAIVLTGIVLLALAIAATIGFGPSSIEEGPLERGQEIILGATVVFFIGATIWQRGAGRLASFGLVLLGIVFFLRELELPVRGPVTAYLNTDAFRLHETIAILALLLPYLALRLRLLPEFWSYAVRLRGWPFVVAAVLVLLGAAAEASVPHLPMPELGVFLEETFETLGYAVLLCLSVHVFGAALRQNAGAAEDPRSCLATPRR